MAEADTIPSELYAVRAGLGSTILNMGDVSSFLSDDFAKPLIVEPPLYMTCSMISSGDFPLTHAGEAVRSALVEFIGDYLRNKQPPGAEAVEG